MEHPYTEKIKKMPVGFTLLAFHRMLFRGEFGALLGNGLLTACTCGLYGFYVAATYNKKSIIKLLEKGFKVKDVEKGTIEQASAKLGINLPRCEMQGTLQAQQPIQPQMQQFGQQPVQPQTQQLGQQFGRHVIVKRQSRTVGNAVVVGIETQSADEFLGHRAGVNGSGRTASRRSCRLVEHRLCVKVVAILHHTL